MSCNAVYFLNVLIPNVFKDDGAAVRPALPAKRAKTRGPRSLKATTASTAGSADGAGGATGGTRKRGGGPVESSQRRERHNSKERDRRYVYNCVH